MAPGCPVGGLATRIGPVPSTAAGAPSAATKLPRVVASRSAAIATNAAMAMKRATRRIAAEIYGCGGGVWPGKLLGGPFVGELDGGPVRGEAAGGELAGPEGLGDAVVVAAGDGVGVAAELKKGNGGSCSWNGVGDAALGLPSPEAGGAGASTRWSGPTNAGSTGPPSLETIPATRRARAPRTSTVVKVRANRTIRRRMRAPCWKTVI